MDPSEVPVDRRPWPGNGPGGRITVEEAARKIRKGATTFGVRQLAANLLKAAGFPKTVRERAELIRRYVKREIGYFADTQGTELLQDAHISLCVPSTAEGGGVHCSPIGDCDDGLIACMSLLGVTDEVYIIDLRYGDGIQNHILGGVKDETGAILEVDSHPGTDTDKPVGSAASFSRERYVIDPWDPEYAPAGAERGEYIGFGKAHEMQRPLTVREFIGYGGATPDDIFTYRTLWNQYVLDTVASAFECGAAYQAVAATQSDAGTKATLLGIGADTINSANLLLQEWNVYAGWATTQPATIVLDGASILQSFQSTVLQAGQLRSEMTTGSLSCALTYHDSSGVLQQAVAGPGASVQAQVIARLEGLGVLASGVLQVLEQTGSNGLVAVGSAAQAAGSFAVSPWLWVSAAVVAAAVATAAVAYTIHEIMPPKRAAAAEPRRKKRRRR